MGQFLIQISLKLFQIIFNLRTLINNVNYEETEKIS